MKQWADELLNKASRSKTICFHGSSRSEDVQEISNYDVVVTSYGTTKDAGLFVTVAWFRGVFNEAHTIKNHESKIACHCLHAKCMWCLSNTPEFN